MTIFLASLVGFVCGFGTGLWLACRWFGRRAEESAKMAEDALKMAEEAQGRNRVWAEQLGFWIAEARRLRLLREQEGEGWKGA